MTILIQRLIAQAVERGEWKVSDPEKAAAVVRDAVAVYLHPVFVAQAIAARQPVEEMLRATLLTLTRAFAASVMNGQALQTDDGEFDVAFSIFGS